LAAKARPRRLLSPEAIRELFEVNVVGTYNVLEACKEADAKLIFPSTREVYGKPQRLPVEEEHPTAPTSPYVTSKLVGELYCQTFYRTYGVKTVILRLTNVYGPGDHGRVVPIFIERAMKGQDLKVFKKDRVLDFVYVEDVIQAMLLAATKNDANGQIFNVGTGMGISMVDLAKHIIELVGNRGARISIEEGSAGDDLWLASCILNINKAKKALGYRPQISLIEGLRRTVKFTEQNYQGEIGTSARRRGTST